MGILQDWLKSREAERVRQHLQFLADAAAKGRQGDAGAILGAIPGATLGGLKMPLDVAGLMGEDLFGRGVGEVASRTTQGSPENARIAQAYASGGPGAALDAATTDPSRGVSWGSGAGAMLADPTFAAQLLLPELAAAENAPKAVKIADLLTGGVFDKGLEVAGGAAKSAASPLARQVIEGIGPLVKKAKPTTAREVIENVAGGPLVPQVIDDTQLPLKKKLPKQTIPNAPTSVLAQQVIDEIGSKPLKLGREKIETGDPLAQPVADLLGAARQTAQPPPPTAMEGLLGAARGTVKSAPAPSAPAQQAIKGANARASKWTPEQLAVFANDPDIALIEQMIADTKAAAKGGVKDNGGIGIGSDRQKKLKGLGFQLSAARKKALEVAAQAPAEELVAPVERRDPAALGGLAERLRLLQATYGPQWRKRLANLTGGLDYLDKEGSLVGPGGDATGILDEYLAARPTLELAGDEAGKQGIKDRLRASLWGDTPPTPQEVAAYREQARKDVFGLLPPDVLARLGGAIDAAPFRSGAVLGGLGGGTLAQDEDGDGSVDPGERLKAVAEGALVGGVAGGATKVPLGTLKDVAQIGVRAGKEGFAHALKEGKTSKGALLGDWTTDKTVTFRNALLDELSNRARALLAGIKTGNVNGTYRSIVDRRKAAQALVKAARTPDEIKAAQAALKRSSYDQELEDILTATGQDPNAFDAHTQFGQGFHGATLGEKRDVLHPLASAATGALMSGPLDASNLVAPGLGMVVGGLRGAARPFTNEAFNVTNDLSHMGVRGAGFKVEVRRLLNELGQQMTDDLAAQGFDPARLSALNSKGVGLFSPKDLVNLGATKEAEAWQQVLAQVYGAGDQTGLASKFVKDTFGNYADNPGALVRNFSKVAPFSRYALGQAPVLARMIAKDPAVALMVANFLARTGGKLPVPTDTPIVGGLAQEELGGAPGEGSVSPLSAVAPVPPSVGDAGKRLGQADNVYQQVQALMGAAGFQFNPLITTAAYVVGADPFGPGSQSRFAGIEQAMPGPQVPTIKGVLDNARKAIAPIDKYGASTDPVETRLNEIVLRSTGKPLADPSNHKLAVALEQDPEHPLLLQAQEEVLHGNAAKSVASGVLPVTVSTKTDVKAAKDQAQAGLPYTPDQIKQAGKVSTQAAKQMQAANDRYKAQHPAAAVNDRPALSARETQDPRLTAWENRNAALKMVNPSVYAAQRKEFMKLAGIR